MTGIDATLEVLTMGRVSVDLYPEQSGVSLAEVRSFAKSLGGSATNVAVAAARLGRRAAVITKVGEDGFGDYVRLALRGFGVDDRFVGTDPELRTPVVFTELHPPDDFPILFYRQPTAPDMRIRPEELDREAIRQAGVFWTTGTGLSEEPSRSATLGALEERGRSGHTVHDLDHRPSLWPRPEEAPELARRALRHATVTVGNQEEAAVAVGEGSAEEQLKRLLDLGPEMAIVKLGPEGVMAGDRSGIRRAAAFPVEVVCGLGAGDAFGGALCHGLLGGWELQEIIEFGNAAGAIVASRLACADAMPDEEEVRGLQEGIATGAGRS